jgi:hypothetical protein
VALAAKFPARREGGARAAPARSPPNPAGAGLPAGLPEEAGRLAERARRLVEEARREVGEVGGRVECKRHLIVDLETGEVVEESDTRCFCSVPGGGWLYVDFGDPFDCMVFGASPEEAYRNFLRLAALRRTERVEEYCGKAERALRGGDGGLYRLYAGSCEEELGKLEETLRMLDKLRRGKLRIEIRERS